MYQNIDKHMFKNSVFAGLWEKFPEKSRAESEKGENNGEKKRYHVFLPQGKL